MKRCVLPLLLVMCAGLLLQQCKCTHLCTNAIPELSFSGFDSAQLGIVILKEYAQDGRFDELEDTTVYTNGLAIGDTAHFNGANLMVHSFSDYVVVVPALGRTWHLRGINILHDHNKDITCTGGVTYWLNDTLQTIPMNTTGRDLPAMITIKR